MRTFADTVAPMIFLAAFALASWNLMVSGDYIDVSGLNRPVAAPIVRRADTPMEAGTADLRRKLGLPDAIH